MTDALKAAAAGRGTHTEHNFALDGGATLPKADVAWLSMGRLNADASNAVMVTHGYTSSHSFIEEGSAAAEGSWSGLVGPGKAIDTNKYFVVSSNALGSCYGSSGPRSINPATGVAFGPNFPAVRFSDIVRLQERLMASFGVNHLHAVVGVSMGGFQTLQWGVQYPDRVKRLVVALSALNGAFVRPGGTDTLGDSLRAEPAWNGGWPAPGAMVPFLTRLRTNTLLNYGMDAFLVAQGLDAPQRAARMHEMAAQWAAGFDANSLVTLRDAISHFDVSESCAAIRARLLLVLSSTDALFPASRGEQTLAHLKARGVDAQFFPLESAFGHLASGLDWQGWETPLRQFLAA